jgi:signal transduction histidine kinase/Tfp pilus assembly protein PilF/CheY-like chemotaxis protein
MGINLRALLATVLIAVAMLCGARPAAAQASAAGLRFDVLVADAKASMLRDPRDTIAKAKQVEIVAAQLQGRQRTLGIATGQWLQGEAYLRLDEVNTAGPLIDRALAAVSHTAPTKLTGDILLSRGGYHTAIANVAAALVDYQRAHNIFRDTGETRSRAIALLSIAGLYQDSMDYENALKYYAQALDVYQGDPQLRISIYNNRGIALKELGRFDEASVEFSKALAIAKTMNSPVLELPILRNVARNELVSGKLDAADVTIGQGFAAARQIAGGPLAANMWDIAAKAALLRHQLPEARAKIERSFAGVDPHNTTISYREAHETAYLIYRGLGEDQKALTHLEALKRLDDKATKLATSTNTALMAARFDYANQELKIAKLRADESQRKLENERARAQTQRLIFVGLAVATMIIVSMLAIGLMTIRRSRNEVRAANIDLAATNSALEKALAAKTEFLATTSHEIRTPLNGILGMTQVMLADKKLDETTRDRIEVVHGAGVSMRALVDDILDVAKMETGNMTIEQVPFDVQATLREVSRMWEEQARAKGIAFTLDLADCPDWIEGDAARLRQITFNLLSNALKFTENGSVSVRATAHEDGAEPRLVIEVVDTGIGIPADKHELIFESFRQVDAGTTRKFGGTGLGLAICRNLARAMHGDVTVRSEAGQGASFTLELPLMRAAAAEEVADTAAETRGLLILDRNPIARSMLRAVLEARAGTVFFAGSVDEAVGLLGAGGVSHLLIDDATLKASDDVPASLAALAEASRDAGARSALLWPAPDDAQRATFLEAGIEVVIAKPIAGAALAAILYPQDESGSDCSKHLVSRAA